MDAIRDRNSEFSTLNFCELIKLNSKFPVKISIMRNLPTSTKQFYDLREATIYTRLSCKLQPKACAQ